MDGQADRMIRGVAGRQTDRRILPGSMRLECRQRGQATRTLKRKRRLPRSTRKYTMRNTVTYYEMGAAKISTTKLTEQSGDDCKEDWGSYTGADE